MYKIASLNNYYPGVESISFDSAISLTDFDIVIIDPSDVSQSLPKNTPSSDNRIYVNGRDSHLVNDLMNRRRSEFSALVNNGKIIITFLTPLSTIIVSSPSLEKKIIDNYSWIPSANLKTFTHQIINGLGTGSQSIDDKHLFAPYYFAFQKNLVFGAYLDVTPDKFRYGEAFILNSANQVLGFSAKVSNGMIVFLPQFSPNEENGKKFVGILLQIAKKYFGAGAKTPPPDWVNSFVVPGVSEFHKKIEAVEKNISELISQKDEIEKEKNALDDFKFLLYEQGHVLESKILEAFKLMGFSAETVPGENTDFDVILESDEGRAIAEVEGRDDGAIHKGKIDQLLSAINQDAEQRDSFAKGILIGNHYRLKTLDQREEPFTKTVLSLAKQYRYALITTVDLYNAVIFFLQYPKDEECKKACRKAIFEADGSVVKFPIPKEKSKE